MVKWKVARFPQQKRLKHIDLSHGSLGRLLFKTLIGSASNYGVYVAGRLDYTIDRPDGCESDNEWIMDYVETCLAVRRWVDMRELYGRAE